jgi:hypothetical protein
VAREIALLVRCKRLAQFQHRALERMTGQQRRFADGRRMDDGNAVPARQRQQPVGVIKHAAAFRLRHRQRGQRRLEIAALAVDGKHGAVGRIESQRVFHAPDHVRAVNQLSH